jgi:Na+/H+ antiporter NhaD/arsenite permease-like protein
MPAVERSIGLAALAGLALATPAAAAETGAPPLGAVLPAWSVLPFLGILLSIALFPLFAQRFWHHHYPKVALAWGALLVVPFVWSLGGQAIDALLRVAVLDYLPFLVLIASLFTIAGGIHVRGALRGTPWVNTGILAAGTVIASWVGTTGAAMLLVRPLLRANAGRRHRAHSVVFFIILVANVGGALTPLGDPPLFLGFLRGVPFAWTFSLLPEFLVVALLVLAVYLVLDTALWRRESPAVRARPVARGERLRIEGAHNFLFLAGVLAAVVVSGVWKGGTVAILGVPQQVQNLLRDLVLVAMLAGSWFTTPPAVRRANDFSWSPIREVAILFAAIFATILPALAILEMGQRGALAVPLRAVRNPAHFFWATGVLSSFLDNAPTYLTFLSTALGRLHPGLPESAAIPRLIAENGAFLKAIATGAVFMGANTYLGNAPNFMVKAIAEDSGVEMPSFFGYVGRYTLPVLVPVFLVVTWIFF